MLEEEMQRYCTQTIKVNFPARVFLGSEYIIRIPPRCGNAVSRVRAYFKLPFDNDVLREKIIEEAEVLNTKEMVYGEFMYIENLLRIPLEKQAAYDELVSGRNVYIHLPFHSFERRMFNQEIDVRILLSNRVAPATEIEGYLLVDFIVTDSEPSYPHFQKIRQIQRLPVAVSNCLTMNVDTYITGPVYELLFTVRDVDTDTYVDAIDEIKLLLNDKERFKLSGRYLRYVEPLKRHGRASMNIPVYTYSLCLDPENVIQVPNGQSHFPERQRFQVKFFDNTSNYEFIIWATSHNFYYAKNDSQITPLFESLEQVIDTNVTKQSSSFTDVPMKISYINVNGVASVTYTSNIEISNVNVVSSNASTYVITQNEINFTGIDSISKSYYANVIFTSSGYSPTECKFVFNGSEVMKNKVQPEEGPYYMFVSGNPIVKIDGGQRFNIASGGTLNTTALGIGNIRDFSIDQYKNFLVKAGSGSNVIYKYDQTLTDTLYSITCSSAVSIGNTDSYFGTDVIPFTMLSTSGTISGLTLDPIYQGVIYNTTLGTFNNVYCDDNSRVIVHSAKLDSNLNTYISGVTTAIGNNIIVSGGAATVTAGNASKRAFFMKFDPSGVYQYSVICDYADDAVNTDVNLIGSSNVVFTCYSNVLSSLYDTATTYTGIATSNTLHSFVINKFTGAYTGTNMKVDTFNAVPTLGRCFIDIFDNFYVSFGYTSSTPSIVTAGVPGFAVIKFNKSGTVAYSISIKGNEVYDVFFGRVTTNMFIQCTNSSGSRNLMNVYSSSTQVLAMNVPNSKTTILAFDPNGNYINYATPTSNVTDFVTTVKDLYYTPLYGAKYFSNTYSQPFSYNTYYWNTFITNARATCVSHVHSNVYISGSGGPSSSNVYNVSGLSSNIVPVASAVGNAFISKFDTNGISKWVARLSPFSPTIDSVSVSADPNHNVYVTGCNQNGVSDMYIYGSDDSQYSKSVSNGQGFVVKYDPNGNVSWSANIYSTFSTVRTFFVKADSQSNVYVLGSKDSQSSLLRMYSPDDLSTLATDTDSSVFMCKYSDTGTPLWMTYVSGNGLGQGGIAHDSSHNVYMTATRYGGSAQTITTVPSLATFTMPASINTTQYVIKYNNVGTVQFLVYIRGTLIIADFGGRSLSTTVDSSDNFYISSTFASNSNANVYNAGNILSPVYITGPTINDDPCGYAVKFNSSGVAQWAVSINSINSDSSKSIVTDGSGNVYLGGFKTSTQATIYEAGNVASSLVIPATQSSSAFVVKFNSSGIAQWVVYIDGKLDDVSFSLSKDASGNILFAGYYTGTNVKIYESNGGTYNMIRSSIGGNSVAFCIKIDSLGFVVPY